MFVGWWTLLRDPRQLFRRPSIGDQDFVMSDPNRKRFGAALGKPTASDPATSTETWIASN